MSVLTVTVSLCSIALLMRSESSRRTACFSLLAVAIILCCAFVEESSLSSSPSGFLLEQLVNTSEKSYGIDTLEKLPMKNRVQREASYQNPREH